jgi:hypothetical protein
MSWTRSVVSAVMIAGAVVGSSTAAQAASLSTPVNGAYARFDGKTINLKTGWDGAQTCVVHSRTLVQCYATADAADKALGYSRATDPLVRQTAAEGLAAASIPDCASGWVCLWAAINGGGRRLIFRDDYWQDLDTYGFANVLSSWRNNQTFSDWAFIADEDPGGPDNEFPASLSGNSYSSNVGPTWNDTADLVQG